VITSGASAALLPARAVADRYAIHIGSLRRWLADGTLPAPDLVINRRRYWRLSTIEAAERRRVVRRRLHRSVAGGPPP
jgi:predicted site-specific integrase-resolvase